jgi:hypothetical protein
MLVVDDQTVDANVFDTHDLCFAEFVHHDTELLLATEANRLAVLEVDQHVGPGVFVEDRVERTVVEHVAVLIHLDERGTRVLVRACEHLDHVLAIHVVRAGDEARLRTDRDRDRVERVVERTKRRRLRDLADLARGRVLTLGQPVDLVVEHQDFDVHVAAQRVDQVIAADRQHVAVAANHPHVQVGARQRDAGRDRGRPAVDAVDSVRVHVVRQAGCATDTRHEHELFGLDPGLRQHELDRGEDAVVATARTPPHLLVGLKILAGELHRRAGAVAVAVAVSH